VQLAQNSDLRGINVAYPVDVARDLTESVITLLVILDPIQAVAFFQGLTARATLDQKKMIAKRASLVTFLVLLIFAYLGDAILVALHITLDSIMIAGGTFLLVFSIRDAAAQGSEARGLKRASSLSTEAASSIAVFPLAIPLLAGPGAIATAIILNDPSYGVAKGITDISTALAISISCIIVWSLLAFSNKLAKVLRPSVMMIIGKVMLILTGAIGVSFIVNGITAILSR
jgi:multiple antibiotic resistance protein